MRILLATPWFADHLDAGLLWAAALGRLGHHVVLWDHRAEPAPPRTLCQVALVMKGDETVAAKLRPWTPNVMLYWPDWFDREPGLLQRIQKAYDVVATPVRPTPEGCWWLPTGSDPQLHHRNEHALRSMHSLAFGTCTPRKLHYLHAIRPSFIAGNGWDPATAPSPILPPQYGPALVNLLSSFQILINVHRDEEVGVNRRLFEMCACGFTLTDIVPGVEEVLGVELTHLVGFTTPQEGRDKLEHYLTRPAERELVWQLEREAIQPYTYQAAAERLLRTIQA